MYALLYLHLQLNNLVYNIIKMFEHMQPSFNKRVLISFYRRVSTSCNQEKLIIYKTSF